MVTPDELREYLWMLDFLGRMEEDREALEKDIADELNATMTEEGRWKGYVRALVTRNVLNSTYGVVLEK